MNRRVHQRSNCHGTLGGIMVQWQIGHWTIGHSYFRGSFLPHPLTNPKATPIPNPTPTPNLTPNSEP